VVLVHIGTKSSGLAGGYQTLLGDLISGSLLDGCGDRGVGPASSYMFPRNNIGEATGSSSDWTIEKRRFFIWVSLSEAPE
jgi:hypothetical protein